MVLLNLRLRGFANVYCCELLYYFIMNEFEPIQKATDFCHKYICFAGSQIKYPSLYCSQPMAISMKILCIMVIDGFLFSIQIISQILQRYLNAIRKDEKIRQFQGMFYAEGLDITQTAKEVLTEIYNQITL